jgi:hypothetical protein
VARGGTKPYTTMNRAVQVDQALQVAELRAQGLNFRDIAQRTGLSTATAWRRWWWLADWTLPEYYGLPRGPFPPQRGTKACRRGRPCLPTLDHPELRRGATARCAAPAQTRARAPCRNWPMRGADRCRMHAAAGQVGQASRRRQLVAEVQRRITMRVHRDHCERGQPLTLGWR